MKRFLGSLKTVDWPGKVADFVISVITLLFGAYLLFYLIEKERDERSLERSAEYGYFTAIFGKHLDIMDEIIKNRQKAIEFFDELVRTNRSLEIKEQTRKWYEISTEAKQANARSLIYMPPAWHHRLLMFDGTFRDAMEELLKPKFDGAGIERHRKLISIQYDSLINISRDLVLNDSLYYSIRERILQ